MAESIDGSSGIDNLWVDELNAHYCADPEATARALFAIAQIHEECAGAFPTLDKTE